MSLIAVISHDRAAAVEQEEADDLARTYVGLRGGSQVRSESAGEWARVIQIGREEVRAESPSTGLSWSVIAGIAHGAVPDLNELEGQFALVSHDSDADAVTVASDPFGMLGLYVAERDGRTYVATSALALAKHLRARPSRLGLEHFLLAGYHFGAVTNWEGIERVEPATRIVFARGGIRRESYWRPEIDAAVNRMDVEEAARHCREVATSAYARLLAGDERRWADLTGGFDTRMLLLLLRKAGVDFRTNTVGDDDNAEVRIARRLAEAAGWEWHQLSLPADWGEVVPSLLPASIAWSDGHLDVLLVSQVLWGHREKSRLPGPLLIGGGGEHFRNFAWQQEFLSGGKSDRVNLDNWVNMRLVHPMDKSVFARDPTDEVKADLRRRMVAWAAPYSSELNTTQLDVMYAYKVTGHFGSYLSTARAFIGGELPFYFRPVFAAAFSTSYRNRNNHRLSRHIMRGLDPRIAAIRTATGGPAEPLRVSNAHRFLPYYGNVSRRALNKLVQKATGRPLFAPPKPDERLVAARRAVIDRMMADGEMRTGRLFDRSKLDGLLQDAARPDFGEDRLLGRIATLELALQAVDAGLDDEG